MAGDPPWIREPDGLRLAVRLTPRAGRNGVAGVTAGADGLPALSVKVAAPPVEGAANKALVDYLADALGVPRSSVTIRSGETARLKIVGIRGDPDALEQRLTEVLGPA